MRPMSLLDRLRTAALWWSPATRQRALDIRWDDEHVGVLNARSPAGTVGSTWMTPKDNSSNRQWLIVAHTDGVARPMRRHMRWCR